MSWRSYGAEIWAVEDKINIFRNTVGGRNIKLHSLTITIASVSPNVIFLVIIMKQKCPESSLEAVYKIKNH